MKKTFVLLLSVFSYSYPQIQPTVSDFLINGTDNSLSTFIQSAPRLYTTNSDNFVAAWSDYRDGVSTVYAQKFDKNGNKAGVNFKANSGSGVYLNKDGYSLSLHKYSESYFEDSYLYITARLFNDLNQKIVEQQIYSAFVPWCGTGFISGEDIITASDNSFYFITNFGGSVSLVKIESSGNIKQVDIPFYNLNYITQITSSCTSNDNYFFAWINGLKGFEEDSLNTGLYATFINSEDSVIVDYLPITQLIDSVGLWEYVGNYTLKSITLNDSTYQLFWLNNASSILYSIKLNINGEIVSGIDSLYVPGSGHQYESVAKVILTDKDEEGFYLFVSHSYYDSDNTIYTNSFIRYNANGQQQGDIISAVTSEFFADNLFNIGSNKFFRVSSDGKDIFLDKLEYFTLLESTRINDDETGSNEHNKGLVNYDGNNVFSIWSDEEKIYGRVVNKEGSMNRDQIELSKTNFLFFPDKKPISTWVESTDDLEYAVGYTIYDEDFNEKIHKTLFNTNTTNNLSLRIQIVSDTIFIALLKSESELKLFEETKSGNTIGERVVVSGETVYEGKIFPDALNLPINSFWIKWGSQLQKFSADLEPLGEIRSVPYNVNYIGDDRFVTVTTEYDYFYINGIAYGTVITAGLDTIKNKLPFAYFKNGGYELLIDRLDNNEFLAINKYSNKYYARAFSNDGIATKDSFLVNRNSTSFVADLNYVVNDDKVFFTWSDVRTSGKGYDIYGSIFDLNSITSVKEITSEVPTGFSLFQNYPNPFNPSTKIRFSLSEFSHVLIKVYDILGNEIMSLVDEDKPAGVYEVLFDGKGLASGTYFYRITAGEFSETHKMVLLK